MFKIGEFSKLSLVSVRMLRHYGELGLLMPEETDVFTGYRYYSADQLTKVGMIKHLQKMGFGLNTVKKILDEKYSPDEMKKMLEGLYSQKEGQIESIEGQMKLIKIAISNVERKEMHMNYSVVEKEISNRYVASVRKRIGSYQEEGMLWEILNREIAPQSPKFTNPPCNIAIYHDEEYTDSNPDVEIQTSVVGKYLDTQNVKFKELPSALVASVTFKGDYTQMCDVNRAVVEWVKENGYRFSGTMFNIYHIGPGTESNPEKFVTESCFPIEKI